MDITLAFASNRRNTPTSTEIYSAFDATRGLIWDYATNEPSIHPQAFEFVTVDPFLARMRQFLLRAQERCGESEKNHEHLKKWVERIDGRLENALGKTASREYVSEKFNALEHEVRAELTKLMHTKDDVDRARSQLADDQKSHTSRWIELQESMIALRNSVSELKAENNELRFSLAQQPSATRREGFPVPNREVCADPRLYLHDACTEKEDDDEDVVVPAKMETQPTDT